MDEKNFILSKDFIDFDIFALPDDNSADFELRNGQSPDTLVAFQAKEQKADLLDLLYNILKAAQLNMEQQVHTLTLQEKSTSSFIQLQAKAQFENALLFGISPADLGVQLDLQLYQPVPFQGCIFVLADKLSDISQDNNKKKALWSCLKDIYL